MKWGKVILAAVCVGLVALELARPAAHGVPGMTVVLAACGSAVLLGVAKILGRWLQRPQGDDD